MGQIIICHPNQIVLRKGLSWGTGGVEDGLGWGSVISTLVEYKKEGNPNIGGGGNVAPLTTIGCREKFVLLLLDRYVHYI